MAVGAGVEYEAAYDGSDAYEFELDPFFAAHWQQDDVQLFWEGIEAGVRWFPGQVWMLSVGARYEMGREEDEDDALDGLGDEDDTVMGLIDIRRGLDASWDWWIAARGMVGDSDKGSLGILALGREINFGIDKLDSEVFAFATLATDAFLETDFGITDAQASTSGYEAYSLDGGFRSVGLTFLSEYRLADDWLLRAEAGFEQYSNEISDSPLVEAGQDYEAEIGLAIAYLFR